MRRRNIQQPAVQLPRGSWKNNIAATSACTGELSRSFFYVASSLDSYRKSFPRPPQSQLQRLLTLIRRSFRVARFWKKHDSLVRSRTSSRHGKEAEKTLQTRTQRTISGVLHSRRHELQAHVHASVAKGPNKCSYSSSSSAAMSRPFVVGDFRPC